MGTILSGTVGRRDGTVGTVRYCRMSQVQSVHCDTSCLVHIRDIVFITGTS